MRVVTVADAHTNGAADAYCPSAAGRERSRGVYRGVVTAADADIKVISSVIYSVFPIT